MQPTWSDRARNLPVGHKARVDCECGKGKTLIINHNNDGYSAFCFRCTFQQFEHKGQQTLQELANIKQLNADAVNVRLKVELPHDYTTEIPLEGRLWLYTAALTPTTWGAYKIGYSPSLQRVVIPIFNATGKLVWFQARAVFKGMSPKYIGPSGDRSSLVFYAGFHTDKPTDTIVVVEDILSATRVGSVTPTVSLLGTKITVQQAALLARYRKVVTWLDSDVAGKTGAYKIRKSLGLATEVSNIRTDHDPKVYSSDQIKEILGL